MYVCRVAGFCREKWGCSGRGRDENTLSGSPTAHHACQNRNPCSFAQRDIISMEKWNLTAVPASCEWRLLLQLSMLVSNVRYGHLTNFVLDVSYLSLVMQTRHWACKGRTTTRLRQYETELRSGRTQEMEWETRGIAKTIMTSTNCVSYGQCECGDISVLCLSVKGWAN